MRNKDSKAYRKEKKDTLADLLTGYDGPVKITTDRGGGFLYCGLIRDMKADDIDAELIGDAVETIETADKQLAQLQRNAGKPSVYFERIVRDAKLENKKQLPRFQIGDFISWMEKQAEQMGYYYKTAGELREYIRKLKPFLKREVVEMYESIDPDEPNTMIVIVEGNETGPAWTTSEYQSDQFTAARNEKILKGIKYRTEVLGYVDSGSSSTGRTVHGGRRRRRVDP